jgi:predicted KAP-like P-loop ATPase
VSKATPQPDHKWSADHPGERPEDDELGRGAFAERVAKELSAWRRDDSLVVSLNGDWGSGKTTLANYILYYIDKQAESLRKAKPPVVKFNPWQWSAQDKLLEGFFSEVGSTFRGNHIADRATAERLLRFWEGLKVATVAGGELAQRFQESLTALAALMAGGSGILSSHVNSPTGKAILEWAGIVFIFIAGVCAVYAPIAEKLGELMKWGLGKPLASLDEIRANLRSELAQLESPLIVVIDDIDRLTKHEMRLLVQLVKANADFPKVIYLLLYQREILANALDDVVAERGGDFLKKIVQVELEIPVAPAYKLRQFFSTQVEPVLSRAETKWDGKRWDNLFNEGIWPYFKTPRDIKRFKSVLEFYFDSHIVEGVLEVNPIDLIVLETLRMFDVEAYEAVSHGFKKPSKLFLEDFRTVGEPKISLDFSIKGLLEREGMADDEKQRLSNLLYSIFPTADESASHSEGEEQAWESDLRICHPKHFRRYFELGADPGEVTASFISKLLKSGSEQDKLDEMLSDTFTSGKFTALMERLNAMWRTLPDALVEPLVKGMFDVSDDLPKIKEGLLIRNAENQVGRFVALLLSRIDSVKERIAILRRTALSSKGITGPYVCLYILRPSEEGKVMPPSQIDPKDLKNIEIELLPQLWAKARSNRFWDMHAIPLFIKCLKDGSGIEKVKDWLAEALKSPKAALALILAMMNESHSSGPGGGRTVHYLLTDQLNQIADLSLLCENAQSVANDELAKYAVNTLANAIANNKEGKPYVILYVISEEESGKFIYDKSDARL